MKDRFTKQDEQWLRKHGFVELRDDEGDFYWEQNGVPYKTEVFLKKGEYVATINWTNVDLFGYGKGTTLKTAIGQAKQGFKDALKTIQKNVKATMDSLK